MESSKCGTDCGKCALRETCGGCVRTDGKPFGGGCVVAECCAKHGCGRCAECADAPCACKEKLIREFRALGIEDMEEVTQLYCLRGDFINLAYSLPNGESVKFWKDNAIYLGAQTRKKNSDRYYGLAGDEHWLLVGEYGENGADAEIVVYKKRK